MKHEKLHFLVIKLKREINGTISNFQLPLIFFLLVKFTKKKDIAFRLSFSINMIRLAILLSISTYVLSGVIFIDRFTLDWNKELGNWSTEFTHNEKRNAIVNLTFHLYKPMTKILIYFKMNCAENEHDWEFKREFIRTVVDGEKVAKGGRMNFFVAALVENLKRFMDFEMRFPFRPVSASC